MSHSCLIKEIKAVSHKEKKEARILQNVVERCNLFREIPYNPCLVI